MTDLEKAFERAIENFDWKKVQKVMEFLKWNWGKKDTPSIEEMQKTVRQLFIDAIRCAFESRSEGGTAGTGGFEVKVETYEDENKKLQSFVKIRFVIEDWDEDTEYVEIEDNDTNENS